MEQEVNLGAGDNASAEITQNLQETGARETILNDNSGASGVQETVNNNQAEAGAGAQTQAQQQANNAPENYAPFTLPQEFDTESAEFQETMSEAQGLFKELNLTQAQAQKLVDFYSKRWIGGAAQQEELLKKLVQAETDRWGEATKRHPEFGGANLNKSKLWVQRAINQLGGSELLNALDRVTGAINHPAIWACFAKLGRDYFSEDKFIRGANTRAVDNSPAGIAHRLYPNM